MPRHGDYSPLSVMSSEELVASSRFRVVCCLAVFIVTVISSHVRCDTSSTTGRKLLLILVDGCRWDYPDEDPSLKGFRRLAENGVRAPYVAPIFPSNSYPNWYTLVTGLYPESHGFVQNMMYDSVYDDFFLMAPNETASVPHWWNEAEPLWITAEKNGIRSALYWWDGCQVEIRGYKPTFCVKYKYVGNSWTSVDDDVKKEMVTAIELLENDEIQLVQIYYEPVDFNGHRYGPDSEQRKAAVRHIDSLLDMVQEMIHAKNLDEQVNIVVVSDHGMISTDPKNIIVINLQHHMDVNDIQYMIYHGSTSMILPKEGKLQKIYEALKKIDGMNVYLKENIPERYHLKNNRLTQPLLLVAKRGYYVQGLDIPGKSIPTGSSISMGSHGYDPFEVPEMRGIFFARGPAFSKGYISHPLENTDIYNMMCDALGMQALPNNGSRTRIEGVTTSASPSAALKYQENTAFLLCILIICACKTYIFTFC